MGRFLLRHWTGLLIFIVAAAWALFYLPATPSFAVFRLKLAIDARDGPRAIQFVDFQSVARHAAREMVTQRVSPGDTLGELVGQGAAQLLSPAVAEVAKSWAERQVDQGARDVQLPFGAVAGAVFLLHRDGNTAHTNFRDNRGRLWEIQMARNAEGQWQVVEVKNIEQLLRQISH